jgi:hypothetical protein
MKSIVPNNDIHGDNIDRRIRALRAGRQDARRAQLMHTPLLTHATLECKTRLSTCWAMLTEQTATQLCFVQDHDHVCASDQIQRSLVRERSDHDLFALPPADSDVLRSS